MIATAAPKKERSHIECLRVLVTKAVYSAACVLRA